MIRPSLEHFLNIAKPEHIVAVGKEISSDIITPVDAYYATKASYLLESSEKGMQVGRYSFLGVEPEVEVDIKGHECCVIEDGVEKRFSLKEPIRIIGQILKSRPYIGEGDLSPFPGGAVGYIGYESVKQWEKIPFNSSKPGLNLPDGKFVFTRFTLAFDNLMHNIKIICNVKVTDDFESDYKKAINDINKIEQQLCSNIKVPNDNIVTGQLVSNFPKQKFMDTVEKIRKQIIKGEAIQVVLSQRISTEYKGDPFMVYRKLRSINPSPYMFFLNFNNFSIFGASPEVMVKVENGKAIVRPIAGTRPRGKNLNEDLKLKSDLLNDEKERAEHLMLVDLARNDLGRVAESGTVSLDKMMDVEMYSHVMHIVSEVSAKLAAREDVFDVIKATFPAGTVSGAPKVRAMKIIEEVEPIKRGPYAGMIGYLSYKGTFDSCITIRSVIAENEHLYMQAGAGIVYDSVPEKEYQETINKAKALFCAISERSK